MDALSVNKLNTSYGKRSILRDVSLSIAAGNFVGLVGVNGAGKTTLIKSILGLCRVDSGEIAIFGRSHAVNAARANLSYLPEKFAPPPYCTCRDFLQLAHRLYGVAYDENRVMQTLQQLDLDQTVLGKPVRQLSKGMTQKLGLTACFLSQKKLLILDEPMSGLDPIARHHVKRMLAEIKAAGITVLMCSHALADVDALCDRMTVIHEGRVAFDDSVDAFQKLFPNADLDEAFMALVRNSSDSRSVHI